MRQDILNEDSLGKISALKQSSNKNAVQELRELANTITSRLNELEKEKEKQEEMKLDEVL